MAFTCAECHDKTKCRHHVPPVYPTGSHPSWPGVKVYLPELGVSVGPCEDCKKERPCVSC